MAEKKKLNRKALFEAYGVDIPPTDPKELDKYLASKVKKAGERVSESVEKSLKRPKPRKRGRRVSVSRPGRNRPPTPKKVKHRDYSLPKLGTIIKKRIQPLSFGTQEYINSVRSSLYGQGRETQLGDQSVSLGMGRIPLAGDVGGRLRRYASAAQRHAYGARYKSTANQPFPKFMKRESIPTEKAPPAPTKKLGKKY
jgi:hypothetical protein